MSWRPSPVVSSQVALIPAPTSSTPASAATDENVPSPLLRYKLLRPKSLATYRSGQPLPLASPHAQAKLYRSLSTLSRAASVTSSNFQEPILRKRKLGGPFCASK